MGLTRGTCRHGPTLCNLYGKARRVAHTADTFLKDHGKEIGQTAQALAPVATALGGPTAGLVTAGAGKFAEEYARVRNEMP